jgi:DNA repair protein SbcC/Rad50
MKYPLIYALSTAGILKHYNQDYLIHPERTDFTGANGVGKSIIADLFQLIFINDKALFQFGTEGYKKEERQIHKLAHRCRDAYTFLTIEVEADQFICIGVCIPNSTNRPLKPFLITADPDNQRPLRERAFGRDVLPSWRNFINEKNQISVIEDLAKSFRDRYGLYFEHYSTREAKDEHYGRLYDQHLLPINLSIPSSLKAFAKIIQSFSRARTGAENRSEELKDFLFDGVEKELEQSFDTHKSEIEKLLRDYDELQKFTTDLEAKQSRLEELDRLLSLQQAARKSQLLGNCGYALTTQNKARTLLEQKIVEYNAQVQKAGLLAAQLPRLQALADYYQSMLSGSEKRLATIKICLEIAAQIEKLDSRISALTLDDLPVVTEALTGEYLIDAYGDQELIRRCHSFAPIYQHYGSMAAIEIQTQRQKQKIQDRKTELGKEIEQLTLVNQLLSGSGEHSLIARVLQSDDEISAAQEAVLFHFLKTHWEKPETAGFPYYAQGFDFFNEEQISADEKLEGYWLRLDDLHIFISALQHQPVLGDPRQRKQAITTLVVQNEALIATAETEMQQLQLFEKGQAFDPLASALLAVLDARLYDYGIVTELAIAAQLVLQLDGKTENLQNERGALQLTLTEQLAQAAIDPESHLSEMLSREEDNQTTWKSRAVNYNSRVISDTATEKTLRETSIPMLEQQTEEKKTQADRASVKYLEERMSLEAEYPELITETLPETKEEALRQLQKEYDDAAVGFQSVYRTALEQFRETAGDQNLEIVSELALGRYNFYLLERALLGAKIRFRDQITEELHTANRTRHKLVDSIHETMLKIFIKTKTKYEEYRALIRDLNLFFKGRTISNKYFFQVAFVPSTEVPIEWINQLQSQSQQLYKAGELPMGDSVEVFVEDFFKTAANYKKKIVFRDLLDPRTYFTLDAGLADENGKGTSGSTGETYSAKVLLGIGRLSKVQSQNRPGIRFIILEETANLDSTNFANFPAIAEDFGYQIITMTPKPFGSDATAGWYLHHLLPGKDDPDINYRLPASYYKTNTGREDLLAYLNRIKT